MSTEKANDLVYVFTNMRLYNRVLAAQVVAITDEEKENFADWLDGLMDGSKDESDEK